ncbi:MAG TPA: hypothetical protein VJA94_07710 [Candidatus Angelobacter sp.]
MLTEKTEQIWKAISGNKELSQQLRSGDLNALQELNLSFEQIYASTESDLVGCGLSCQSMTGACPWFGEL